MEYNIILNRQKVIAHVNATGEYEALYKFASQNMNHVDRLGDNFFIENLSDRYVYYVDGNEFSVEKLFIW